VFVVVFGGWGDDCFWGFCDCVVVDVYLWVVCCFVDFGGVGFVDFYD